MSTSTLELPVAQQQDTASWAAIAFIASGRLPEVGVVEWHEQLAIVHAMPARPKFLR